MKVGNRYLLDGRQTNGASGYIRSKCPGHPRANRAYVLEHILVAEHALGRHLPHNTEVHHVDEDTSNNNPSNLVICQDRTYHQLLHRRKRALEACGDPSVRFCVICKKYDRQESMRIRTDDNGIHRDCKVSYDRAWRAKRRSEVTA